MFDAIQNFLAGQPQSFYVGAAIIIVYQAAKFGELNLADPIIQRYVAYVPNVTARDFAGRFAYYGALVLFLFISLIVYYGLCQISPEIMEGAAKVFTGDPKAGDSLKGVPYPIYVAALFLGLTQPIIPGFSRFGTVQRDFFHDQIDVPHRVIELSENAARDIIERCDGDRKKLRIEIETLLGTPLRKKLEPLADLTFFGFQLEKMELKDSDEIDRTLDDASTRELKEYIERIITLVLISTIRKSGGKRLDDVIEQIQGVRPNPTQRITSFLARLFACAFLFGIAILAVAHLLLLLSVPIVASLSADLTRPLWPTTLRYVGSELWAIVPPIFFGLLISLYSWSRRSGVNVLRLPSFSRSTFTIDELVEFANAVALSLATCFAIAFGLNVIQTFYSYGVFGLPPSLRVSPLMKAALLLIKATIPTALCYITLLYLANQNAPRVKFHAIWWTTCIFIVISILSVLYDLSFLHLDYFEEPRYKSQAPGWDHVLFAVVSNSMASLCAFWIVILTFKSGAGMVRDGNQITQAATVARSSRRPTRTVENVTR